jgi:hypothetical protein
VSRALTLGGVAAAVVAVYLIAATGGRFALPSPSTIQGQPQFRVRLARARQRSRLGLGGQWIPGPRRGPDGGYLRLTSTELHVSVMISQGRRPILRVVARPLRGLRATGCLYLEVAVDGVRAGTQPLRRRLRTYAFALPPLVPGRHEVTVRVPAVSAPAGAATLALRSFRIENGG